jgi:hypothetical protein|tara:strand:- start:356 stop:460 length:105 start_codon:yes stop_codon:yes gene_type:complete
MAVAASAAEEVKTNGDGARAVVVDSTLAPPPGSN